MLVRAQRLPSKPAERCVQLRADAVDHGADCTLALADRVYLLYDGRILTHGTAEALAEDEEVRRRYLGQSFTLERYAPPPPPEA